MSGNKIHTFKTSESKSKWQHWIHDSKQSGWWWDQLKHEGCVRQEEAIGWTQPELQTLDGESSYQVTPSTVTCIRDTWCVEKYTNDNIKTCNDDFRKGKVCISNTLTQLENPSSLIIKFKGLNIPEIWLIILHNVVKCSYQHYINDAIIWWS